MKTSKALLVVALLVGLLAAVQSGSGLFVQTSGTPWDFTTLHDEQVQISGQGIYAYDTAFKVPIFRGTDAVTLFLCIPLLAASLYLTARGSLRARLVLTGVLAYLLYNAASVALGSAYNNLFLVYVAYFSASLFGLALAVRSINVSELAARISPAVPRKGLAALMFVSALGLMAAWLPDILGALARRGYPALASYTTEVTYVFDLGIIIPLSIVSGVLILRKAPLGYLLCAILSIILVIVGVLVSAQTVFQMSAGFTLTVPEFAAKAGSFMLLSLFSIYMVVRLLRGISEQAPVRAPARRAARA